jgi:transketolase
MRRALAKTLVRIGEEDPRLIFLTGDLGFQVFEEFAERYGPRYINVGVAEAQMVCAAAGLALEGWRPVVYSIASFATARAFEQIRISVNYQMLPVVIIGAGGGYFYAPAGVTHHAADDLGLMTLLPGMTVVAPGDPDEVGCLLPDILRLPGPAYVRIGGFGEPNLHAVEPAVLGRGRLLRNGERVAVLSTGTMAAVVLKALDMVVSEGIRPIAYQVHTVKPVDAAMLDAACERAHTIVVVEEHVPSGGLTTAVQQWQRTRQAPVRILRLGPPDQLALGHLRLPELRRRFACDADAVAACCRAAWCGQTYPTPMLATIGVR